MAEKQDKPAPDWDQIEAQYRVNTKPLRDIASEHGITEGAIRKRAKRDDWPRDLAAKVRARTAQLVRKELVRKDGTQSTQKAATEKQTVEIEAQVRARLEIGHQTDAAVLRTSAMAMVKEQGALSGNLDAFKKLGELMIDPGEDKTGKLRDAFDRALSMAGRAKVLKDSVETAVKAIQLERTVNRLDEGEQKGDGGFEAILASIHAPNPAAP